jgi:hypothetical protein
MTYRYEILKSFIVLVLIAFFLCLLNVPVCAQDKSIRGIKLKNGSIVYGKVLEMTVYKVVIETREGKKEVYKFEDVAVFIFGSDEERARAEKLAQTKNSSFEIGLTYYHFDYKEKLDPPKKSTENGWLPGIYLSTEYKKKSDVYAKLFLSYATGELEYDGSTQTGTPLKFSELTHEFYKVEGNVGYSIEIRKDFSLIPYIGYGFRNWKRGDTTVVQGAWWIKEKYNWHYIPLGLKCDYTINERWEMQGNLAAHYMFYGRMKLYYSEVDPGYGNYEFDLGNRVGWYVEAPITYKINKDWSIVTSPWYEYSAIGQSNTVNIYYYGAYAGSAYEPASRTHQYGLNLGLSYKY